MTSEILFNCVTQIAYGNVPLAFIPHSVKDGASLNQLNLQQKGNPAQKEIPAFDLTEQDSVTPGA